MTDPIPATGNTSLAAIHWLEDGVSCTARWRSERGASAPQKVVLADDRTTADAAYRLACEGTGLLWRGDFQNARQLLQALTRRADKSAARPRKASPDEAAGRAFHLHRQARAQRARVLGMLLLPFGADHQITLRRAPDARAACAQAWGAADSDGVACVVGEMNTFKVCSALSKRPEWSRDRS
jgi:hypothetical protein